MLLIKFEFLRIFFVKFQKLLFIRRADLVMPDGHESFFDSCASGIIRNLPGKSGILRNRPESLNRISFKTFFRVHKHTKFGFRFR